MRSVKMQLLMESGIHASYINYVFILESYSHVIY